MTGSLTFIPLLCGDDPSGPVCHLLRGDCFSILIGCGWDERFSIEQLEPVIK